MTIHDHHYHHHHQQHYHSSLPSSSATLHARHTAIATKTTAQLKSNNKSVNYTGFHFHCDTFFDAIPTYEQEERSLRHSVVAIVEAVVVVLVSDSR
jgi:hypothetical protein